MAIRKELYFLNIKQLVTLRKVIKLCRHRLGHSNSVDDGAVCVQRRRYTQQPLTLIFPE